MGQTHPQRQSKPTMTVISRQNEKLRFMEELNESMVTEPPEENSECCTIWRKGSSSQKNDEAWKKRMIDEMTNLRLENTWPQQLVNFLKKQKTIEIDKIYQSDVLWFDNTYEKKPLNQDDKPYKFMEIGKLSFIEQNSRNDISLTESVDEKSGKNDNVPNPSSAGKGEKNEEIAFNILLDSSEIFDEKVNRLAGKESWMDKSFDIKMPEYSQPIPSYFDQVPPYNIMEANVRHSGFLRSNSVVSNDLNASKRPGETYNNNTILNQVPLSTLTSAKSVTEANKMYQSILKYKTITNIIEKHLDHPNNIFRQIINLFESYFIGQYSKIVQSLQQNDANLNLNELESYSVKATLDLQQFIRIFYEGLNSYYRLRLLKVGKFSNNETLFNRDNVLNFVASLIFSENIYNIIFELYKRQDKQTEEAYQASVKLCKHLGPEDFTIPASFCLNQKTVQYFKDKGLLQKSPSTIKEESIKSKSYDSPEKHNIIEEAESAPKSASISIDSKKEDIMFYISPSPIVQEKPLELPYKKAIAALSHLKKCRSPVHKVKAILKVIELISTAIEDFYKEHGVPNAKKLDGDHTLAICIYVVSKSGVGNIKTHCKLIERFSTTNILNSISGYYMTTLEACVDCLCGMDLNHVNDVSMTLKQCIHSFDLSTLS